MDQPKMQPEEPYRAGAVTSATATSTTGPEDETTMRSRHSFPLMQLPVEMRLMILGQLFVAKIPIRIPLLPPPPRHNFDMRLLRMNKQLWNEIEDVFYGKNKFRYWPELSKYRNPEPTVLRKVRNLTIMVGIKYGSSLEQMFIRVGDSHPQLMLALGTGVHSLKSLTLAFVPSYKVDNGVDATDFAHTFRGIQALSHVHVRWDFGSYLYMWPDTVEKKKIFEARGMVAWKSMLVESLQDEVAHERV